MKKCFTRKRKMDPNLERNYLIYPYLAVKYKSNQL